MDRVGDALVTGTVTEVVEPTLLYLMKYESVPIPVIPAILKYAVKPDDVIDKISGGRGVGEGGGLPATPIK